LSREQFENLYGIKWKTALGWARDGIIKVVRLGRKVFIEREEIDRIIANGGKQFPGGWRRQAEED
jgi:predicted site-specific integrase-resolvase